MRAVDREVVDWGDPLVVADLRLIETGAALAGQEVTGLDVPAVEHRVGTLILHARDGTGHTVGAARLIGEIDQRPRVLALHRERAGDQRHFGVEQIGAVGRDVAGADQVDREEVRFGPRRKADGLLGILRVVAELV
jgi:hypothetical protein